MRVLALIFVSLAIGVDAAEKFAVLNRVRSAAKSSTQVAVLDKLTALIEKGETFKIEQQPQINCTVGGCADDKFCEAICTFIEALPDIEKFIFNSHDETIKDIGDKSDKLVNESGDAVSELGELETEDEKWANCTKEAWSLAKTADEKNDMLETEISERALYCADENDAWESYLRSITIGDFECDLADLPVTASDSCEKKLAAWKDGLLTQADSIISHLEECIRRHGDVVAADAARSTAYDNHNNKRSACTTQKGVRDNQVCVLFPDHMKLYCDSRSAYEGIIQDVDGEGTQYSIKDRVTECQGIRALDCVMREIQTALAESNSTFELDEGVLDRCQNQKPYTDCAADFEISDAERKVPEYTASIADIDCIDHAILDLTDAYVYDSACLTPMHPHDRSPSKKMAEECYTLTENRTVPVTKNAGGWQTEPTCTSR